MHQNVVHVAHIMLKHIILQNVKPIGNWIMFLLFHVLVNVSYVEFCMSCQNMMIYCYTYAVFTSNAKMMVIVFQEIVKMLASTPNVTIIIINDMASNTAINGNTLLR
jgi:hypothetical protein